MKFLLVGLRPILLASIAILVFTNRSFSQVQKKDSLKLPFAIADEKELSEEDLKDKKEGVYITGTPDFSSDPVNGIGYGGEGSLYFNGKRSDPFFKYTAYRAKLDLTVFNTTKDQREFLLALDVPYIFNTKWRLRVEGGYEANPNLLFFGLTPKESLKGLTYYPGNDSTKAPVTNARYSDYEKNGLVGVNQFYNNYFKKEGVLNVSVERSFFGDKVGTLIGFEIAQLNYSTFSGNSLLQKEYNAGLVKGVKDNFITIAQFGVAYDTRDLEPDPSSGLFLEVTDEVSSKSLGSTYNFNKIYAHANWYQSILPSIFPKLVFAGRLGLGYISGDAPFFCLAVSPDGKWAAAGTYVKKTIELWNIETGKLEQTLQTGETWARNLVFSPDSKLLIAGCHLADHSGEVQLWDVSTGKLQHALKHDKYVNSVAVSPDGKMLASGSGEGSDQVQIWDTQKGAFLRSLRGGRSGTRCVAFSPDGQTIAAGWGDGKVRLWDVQTGEWKETLKGHSSEVYSLAFSAEGKTLASTSQDTTVRIWSINP